MGIEHVAQNNAQQRADKIWGFAMFLAKRTEKLISESNSK